LINDYRRPRFNAATEELENPAGTSLSLSQININNGNRQNWADIKPSQPYIDNTSVSYKTTNTKYRNNDQPYLSNAMSDEYTDAGGTYNSLERIYSKEIADQMSYEYSLEDGKLYADNTNVSFKTIKMENHRNRVDLQPSQPYVNNGMNDEECVDQMSYEYSLEDWIMRKKVADTASYSGQGSGFIKTDVPGGSFDDYSFDSLGNSVYAGLTFDDESVRKQDEYGGILPHRASHNTRHDDQASPLVQNTYKRMILAPKGKLGVVIDTTNYGPVVFQVKDGSPLQGALFPGDRIIAIDDIDTTGMIANNITTIMARKAELERMITVVRVSKKNVHGGAYA
jgi:hypothetical protein